MRRTPLLILALAAWTPSLRGQSLDLDRVLELTSAYLLEYEKQLTAVVAEE